MNYYLSKYVDTFRVKSDIDLDTNDYCRDINGNLCNNLDIYIYCANGIKIFHYGGSTLQAYIPSLGRGRNILITIGEQNSVQCGRDYETLYKVLQDKKIISNIEETDAEILFRFSDKRLMEFAPILKVQTYGASISPFSTRNLPQAKSKNKYQYSNAQIEDYKKITSVVPKEDSLILGQITNRFIKDILTKKTRLDLTRLKADMKKQMLKTKDYIYTNGYEIIYLDYLQKELKKLYGSN